MKLPRARVPDACCAPPGVEPILRYAVTPPPPRFRFIRDVSVEDTEVLPKSSFHREQMEIDLG